SAVTACQFALDRHTRVDGRGRRLSGTHRGHRSDPSLLWIQMGRAPTILPHDLPNPLQPDGVLGSEFLNYLPSDEFRVPLQYLPHADSCRSRAINVPSNPLLGRTSLGSGNTTGSQVRKSANDTRWVLGSHARYHLIRGAFWLLLPYG